ncbi:MAG: autotransporter domain-containing protein [Alphaproteobacteria bacterium]
MIFRKVNFISAAFFTALMCSVSVPSSMAEDCTGILPGADCTLNEDTNASLNIDNGVTLFTSGSINIDHAIDGSAVVGDGNVATSGGGNTVTQSANIGGSVGIEQLSITGDDTWTTSAAINTDNDGSDIDLGAGDGGEVLNFLSGSSFIGEIDGHNGDIVNFGADGAGGDFVTATQIEGVSVVLTSGNLTIGSSAGSGVPLGDVTVNSNTNLTVNANVTTGGALDVDGDVTIRAGRTLSADTYVADADSASYSLGVRRETGTNSTARINVSSGGPVDFSNDTMSVFVDPSSQMLVNGTITNIITGNGGATVLPSFSDNSYLYNFALQQNGDNVDLVVTVNDLDSLASSSSNQAAVQFLLGDLSSSEDQAINQIQSILGNAETRSAFNEALESVLPDLDGGYAAASYAVMDHIQGAIYDRSVSNRFFTKSYATAKSDGQFIFASGDKDLMTGQTHHHNRNEITSSKGSVWTKALYQAGSQASKDVDGFDLNTAGLMVGVDIPDIDNDYMFGGALLIGRSDVKSDNANSSQTDVDSFGVSLYGGRMFAGNTILNGSVSYIRNDNDVTRFNVGTLSGSNATGSFKSEQISLNAGISQHRPLQNGSYFQPHAFVKYDYLSADEYREKGNSDLGLRVRYSSLNNLAAGAGAIYGKVIKHDDMVINPTANLSYEYSAIKDSVESIVELADSEFKVKGHDPSKHMLNAGVNLKVQKMAAMQFDAGYNLGYDGDQDKHSLSMKMVYGF